MFFGLYDGLSAARQMQLRAEQARQAELLRRNIAQMAAAQAAAADAGGVVIDAEYEVIEEQKLIEHKDSEHG